MTEWQVFLIISALLAFAVSIVTPIIKLTTAITSLQGTLDILGKDLKELKKHNSESHQRIWRHNEEQDDVLHNHETRIQKLEHGNESNTSR